MRKEYKEVFLAFGRNEKKNLRLKYFEIHFVACFFLKINYHDSALWTSRKPNRFSNNIPRKAKLFIDDHGKFVALLPWSRYNLHYHEFILSVNAMKRQFSLWWRIQFVLYIQCHCLLTFMYNTTFGTDKSGNYYNHKCVRSICLASNRFFIAGVIIRIRFKNLTSITITLI